MKNTLPWWTNNVRLAEFTAWLADRGLLNKTTDWVGFLDDPRLWVAEYDEFCGEEMDQAVGRLHAV